MSNQKTTKTTKTPVPAAAAYAASPPVSIATSNDYLPIFSARKDMLSDAIPLVDSRHDFKNFSQDIPKYSRNKRDPINLFSHYSANIQREVLGLDTLYSQKYTSKCNLKERGIGVMGIGPEQEFLSTVVAAYGVTKHTVAAPRTAGLVIIAPSSDLRSYHVAIKSTLQFHLGNPSTIPLCVDTSRTLNHLTTDDGFLVCLSAENIADPSNTIKTFLDSDAPFIRKESGNSNRTYSINNIEYNIKLTGKGSDLRVKGAKIEYSHYKNSIVYEVDMSDPHKPTEKEICKATVQNKINFLNSVNITYKKNDSKNSVGELIDMYENPCDYAFLYSIDDKSKFEAIVPYIAKRGGDQLQVLSCKQNITYDTPVKPPRVFWTIDLVATAFAIMNDVITVLQRPDKQAEIYIPPIRGLKGGRPCLRSDVAMFQESNVGYKNMDTECYSAILRAKFDRTSPLFDINLVLDILSYNLQLTKDKPKHQEFINFLMLIRNICKKFESTYTNLEKFDYTSVEDSCVLLYNLNHDIENGMLTSTEAEATNISDLKIIVTDRDIKLEGILKDGVITEPFEIDKITINSYKSYMGLKPQLNSDMLVPYYLYGGKRKTRKLKRRGGGNENFFVRWQKAQSSTNINELLYVFQTYFKILATCEDMYFFVEDKADNFYAYDTKRIVRIGGHTNLEMAAFFKCCFDYYKKVKERNEEELYDFLRMFVNFPNYLQITNNDMSLFLVLNDLQTFIGLWHSYTHVFNKNFDKLSEKNKCDTIYFELMEDVKKIVLKAPYNNENEFIDFIIEQFPHGLFTSLFKQIEYDVFPQFVNLPFSMKNVKNISKQNIEKMRKEQLIRLNKNRRTFTVKNLQSVINTNKRNNYQLMKPKVIHS